MTFNPNAPADPYISFETGSQSQAAKSQTDAERISAARERAMARSKDMNAPGAVYGFGFPESHYQDFAGPETSDWDARVLVSFGNILEAPILNRNIFVWPSDQYDPRTGEFTLSDGSTVSIAELKSAIDARIVELGLSKVKIREWFSDVREPIGSEWWRQELPIRIQRFKAA